ncbi:MAG: tandem-95 repeat protein [Planctomycetales bacterium]|nr:tandem-95 repeat protein [Planctomycetales bacterium]
MLVETLESRKLLATIAWSSGPSLPSPRTDAVAVLTSDNAIRLVGGDSAAATDSPVLTSGASAWSLGIAIDTQRTDLGAVRSGGSVILFGGTGNNEGSSEALSYDYRLGDSQDLDQMNDIRFDHGFASDASGRAYAIGGIGVLADGEIWASVERYSPTSDSWTAIAPLPQPLHGLSATGDGNGHVFVFGGSSTIDDSGIQSSAYRYDIATDSWSLVGPMPIGTRDSALAVDTDGLIYITGGMTSSGATDAVQQYDPTTNAWSIQTPLPAAVYSHAAAFDAGNRIVVAGGFDAAGIATASVYRTQDLSIPDIAPVMTSSPKTTASLDTFYTYDVNASGNPVPTYSLAAAPTGMTIDGTTGLISWQPVAGQEGLHSVIVEASNRAGTVQQPFDITVVADTIAPTIPANFTFDDATVSSVTFNWDSSTDASGIDHYEIATAVYTGPRFGKHWVYTVVGTFPDTATTGTIMGLNPLEGHSYAVRAVDMYGVASGWSARVGATTLAAPTLGFQFGTQTTGVIQSREQTPIAIQLVSQANPAPTFELVSGPAGMTVDLATGAVNWTPDTPDVGAQTAVFRATNSVGSTDLVVDFDILPDTPKLAIQINPTTGEPFATAGVLFNAQVLDSSTFPSTFELLAGPTGMTMDAAGLISWTPTADQGGINMITVRGTNSGGSSDLTISILTAFTGAVSNVVVTGETTQISPTVTWSAPTGEGADLVTRYNIQAYTRYHYGSHTYSFRTHIVDYVADAGSETVDLTGLLTGKTYTLTITPVSAAGVLGVANNSATVVTAPDLPSVQWTVNGAAGTPANVVAGKPLEIALTDYTNDPSDMELVSGPVGLTFDPITNIAAWTPTATDVNTGYATTDITFRVTNSVGPVDVIVPIHVMFSGSVINAAAFRNGYTASASWDAPTDNVTPVAAYSVTRYWTFAGSHKASATYTLSGDTTSFDFTLSPTGAVVHTGITIVPVDEFGNFGVSTQKIAFGSFQNDLPPIANDDNYNAIEDTILLVNSADGVRANDIDTDNTPGASVLTPYLVSGTTNGTLILGSTGTISYTPDPDFNGTDSFVYRLYDGRFYSDNATVTINVDAVNDAPAALDDYYTLAQNTPFNLAVANGVLANDFDVDGDVMIASIATQPVNGTVVLSPDGSFVYTPNAGFSGSDSFSYVATDTLLDSRVATVNLDVRAMVVSTKFFVVDTDVESTFEYASDGTLVATNGLRDNNRGAQGAAASSDGSNIYVVNGNLRVFVYDDAGGYQGFWTAVGPERADGIATDDTDIWILDRKLDIVFHYANAAALRGGEIAATDSFGLHANNKNGKGITTDGTHLWIVNDIGGLDKVYKYTIDGTYVGRWNIDPVNEKPTGITIDPTGATDDIWIVDNLTDSIYQYNGGASRIEGSAIADAVFTLDAANTNPQGIADPASVVATPAPASQSIPPVTTNVVGDVNGDGLLSTRDALMIINDLGSGGSRDVASRSAEDLVLDVNGDGQISASDALYVINRLSRKSANPSSIRIDAAIDQLTRKSDGVLGGDMIDEVIADFTSQF